MKFYRVVYSWLQQISFGGNNRFSQYGQQDVFSLSEELSPEEQDLLIKDIEECVVKLFVGLPLDGISDCNTLVHAKAIGAALRALKLLGVVPVWWGIVENEAMGKYDWSGYIALAKMVQDAGLELRVSLCFHASKEPAIPLPQWVAQLIWRRPT